MANPGAGAFASGAISVAVTTTTVVVVVVPPPPTAGAPVTAEASVEAAGDALPKSLPLVVLGLAELESDVASGTWMAARTAPETNASACESVGSTLSVLVPGWDGPRCTVGGGAARTSLPTETTAATMARARMGTG